MAKPKFNKHDLVYVSDDENLFKDGMLHFDRGFYAVPREITNIQGEWNYMLMMLDDSFSYKNVCGWYHEYQLKLVRHNVNIGIKDVETNKTITLKDITNGQR